MNINHKRHFKDIVEEVFSLHFQQHGMIEDESAEDWLLIFENAQVRYIFSVDYGYIDLEVETGVEGDRYSIKNIASVLKKQPIKISHTKQKDNLIYFLEFIEEFVPNLPNGDFSWEEAVKQQNDISRQKIQATNNYKESNRHAWNQRVEPHLQSELYDLEGFKNGATSLNTIELDLLGDVSGKSILHLQCHFGQDSLSLARMGAKVVGVDLSDKAIETAKNLNTELGLDAEFVCCDVYDSPNHINQQFDIVFTTYGTIGWLPDMDKWAGVISQFLKPGGKLVFVEFHPVVWMFDDDFTHVAYNYFNAEPIVETTEGTYADRNAPIKTETISWNHDLGEVIGALISKGLVVKSFKEYNYSPYNVFRDMEQIGERQFRLKKMGNKLPMVYSLVCSK